METDDRPAQMVAWFVALIHSTFQGQLQEAAEAQRQLHGLGVEVKLPNIQVSQGGSRE